MQWCTPPICRRVYTAPAPTDKSIPIQKHLVHCPQSYSLATQRHQLRTFANDIKAHGLQVPVTTYQGKILDGRNRWRACEIAGVDPTTAEYTGDDPLAFVVSGNLIRRHLSASQRGMVAAKMAGLPHGGAIYSSENDPRFRGSKTQAEAAEMMNVSSCTIQKAAKVRRGNPTGANQHGGNTAPAVFPESKTIEQAAKDFGISADTVQRACTVAEHGVPELIEAVKNGSVAVKVAAGIAKKLTPEQQQQVVAKGPQVVKEAAHMLNVGTATVKQARFEVTKGAPELVASVIILTVRRLTGPNGKHNPLAIHPPFLQNQSPDRPRHLPGNHFLCAIASLVTQ